MVIQLRKIAVTGKSQAGAFSGVLEFSGGLQVISAHNSFGKSLAVKSVIWCLALEPIFGSPDNEPVRMPEAVRKHLDLDGTDAVVISSQCSIILEDEKGRKLEITRAIEGGDTRVVEVRETEPNQSPKTSKLMARRLSMQDEHGGFQRFLFEWLGWPRVQVPTFRGTDAEIYLENLAPLFYIEQKLASAALKIVPFCRNRG